MKTIITVLFKLLFGFVMCLTAVIIPFVIVIYWKRSIEIMSNFNYKATQFKCKVIDKING